MEKFSTVEDFLIAQMTQRPVTYKEITLCVEKNERGVLVEMRRLVKYGRVHILEVRFNQRVTPFYTIRRNVSAEIGTGIYANPLNKKISLWKMNGRHDGDSGRRNGGANRDRDDVERNPSGDGGSPSRRGRVFKCRKNAALPYLVVAAEEADF